MVTRTRIILQRKMLQFSYIIIDPTPNATVLKQQVEAMGDFINVGISSTREDGVNKILEHKPQLVFISVDGIENPLNIISELSEFMDDLPTVIMLNECTSLAFDAYQRGFTAYLKTPVTADSLRRTMMRFVKNYRIPTPKKICIKSQGDYHFLTGSEILYLKADNNTTDFFLTGGKVITAYKTLKYFENLLPPNFYRIHHSYIVNSEMISRINLTKNDCYLNNSIILPYSRTYKGNVDRIIEKISN